MFISFLNIKETASSALRAKFRASPMPMEQTNDSRALTVDLRGASGYEE
ncbi:hypothetical protein QE394_000852 [Arthrobacter sp. SORGH_AS 212]|nr:hypothetical protein [Arthrobacter sp. SORGH_AS_0212]